MSSIIGNGKFAPPPGGDRNHGIALRDVTIVTFTLALFMSTMRLSARVFLVKKTGWDDWIMTLATSIAAVQTSFILKCVASGGGRHQFYLSKEQQLNSTKWNTLSQIPLVVSNCLIKLSICFLIIRITNNRQLVKWMWALIGALVLVNGACFVNLLAQCRPIQAYWDYSIQHACWSEKILTDISWLQGVFSIVSDLICTSLPIVILWNIQISSKKKFAICGLMALGLFTTACSIVRMEIYGRTTSFIDSSFTLTTLEIWSILEQNIGIIAANTPVLSPIYVLVRDKTPGLYGSLNTHHAGFSKLSASKDPDPLDQNGETLQYPGGDKRGFPLKPLARTGMM
ncbi:MAG: hypothetical protein ASARMPRED_008249 [Alectoria sarmentosa]|nr:MAG: hypothetical protein ASARMPRED_008249 [Alectoria sarmentosa]